MSQTASVVANRRANDAHDLRTILRSTATTITRAVYVDEHTLRIETFAKVQEVEIDASMLETLVALLEQAQHPEPDGTPCPYWRRGAEGAAAGSRILDEACTVSSYISRSSLPNSAKPSQGGVGHSHQGFYSLHAQYGR